MQDVKKAIDELLAHKMIVTDKDLVESIMPTELQFDEEKEEYLIPKRFEQLAQFLESFTASKLNKILKFVNTKVKNVVLDNFLEMNEVHMALNPFYQLEEVIRSYENQDLSDRFEEMITKLSGKISRFMGV